MRRLVVSLGWLPLALYLAASIYIRRLEGWGQWAAASVFLPSLISSVILGALGAILLGLSWLRKKRFDLALFVSTVLASSIAVSVWIRVSF